MELYIEAGQHRYPIILRDSFDALEDSIKKAGISPQKVCIVADTNVDPLYGDIVKEHLSQFCRHVVKYAIPAGESSKHLETVEKVYEFCLSHQFDRQSVIVALGGGVVGDLGGFVASTYMRGIGFIQIPTTLLAQNDSSVGGKVGVDFKNHKNMIGAFYQPQLVYMNTATLLTLSERDFASGMAEVIKHGLIRDKVFYNSLKGQAALVKAMDYQAISQVNLTSCRIKGDVVAQDEKEGSIRKILNFGHTIGHAIETLSDFGYLHGEAVSLGMVAVAYISFKRDMLTKLELSSIIDMLQLYDLPTHLSSLLAEDIYEQLFFDKKISNNTMVFILLNGIGDCVEVNNITKEEIINSIGYLQKGE